MPEEGRVDSPWDRWIRIEDLALRYDIPSSKVEGLLRRGAWPCHSQSGMMRFSPEDQASIEQKWHKHRGEDPPRRTPGWHELALKDDPTDMERHAVKRGFEALQYLRSLAD